MRRLVAVALGVASVSLGAGLVACFDLFHPTADVLTACQIDAETPGCSEGGADASEAGTDFCAWDEVTANRNAEHACAWLGACETPLGQGAFGNCMFEALLAYDCKANPNHPVTGERHARWDCLWKASSCADVESCVFPAGVVTCTSGVGTACGAGPNKDVRVECASSGKVFGENCALWGQTCAALQGGAGFCKGNGGAAGISCTDFQTCDQGTGEIHACDGGDFGIACGTNGAGGCGGFPTKSNPQWVACLPVRGGAACDAGTTATCANGVATTCLTGVTENLDCDALLRSDAGCTPGDTNPNFDWTSPCVVSAAPADAGTDADAGADASTCTDDCSGSTLTGCTRGSRYMLDCSRVGLGACHLVTADPSEPPHAACTAP